MMHLQKHDLYIPSLNAVRVFATAAVLLFHLQPTLTVFFGRIPLIGFGYLGVDVLFALSGFVIAYHYAAKLVPFNATTYRKFLLARLIRLYPVHLTALFAVLILVKGADVFGFTINNPEDYTWQTFKEHLLLISAWQIPARMTWNHYAWAISALWCAYLLTPFILYGVKQLTSGVALLLAGCFLLGWTPVMKQFYLYDSLVSYALFRAVCGYAIGMILYQWMTISNTSLKTVAFDNAPMRFAGHLTYAVYMMQFVVIMPFKKIFPPESYADFDTAFHIFYIAAEIGLIIALAVLVHRFVEEPARRFLNCYNL